MLLGCELLDQDATLQPSFELDWQAVLLAERSQNFGERDRVSGSVPYAHSLMRRVGSPRRNQKMMISHLLETRATC